MTPRALKLTAAVACALTLSVLAAPLASRPEPTRTDRLAALAPENPGAYFELAEEIADEARTPDDLALARTLYVLAFDLARSKRPNPTNAPTSAPASPTAAPRTGPSPEALAQIAASACLGLAELERLPHERRWLRALAGLQDSRYAERDWNVPAAASQADETAYRAATALGLARSGDGRQAQELLDKPGVRAVLQEYERAIGDSGHAGAISRLEKYIRAWPCPECQNRRFVAKPGDRGGGGGGGGGNQPPEFRICFTCKGNPGPVLSNHELMAQLGFESALLAGVQRSWAAELAVRQSAPLRDPDPAELAPTYRVDPTKVYWREGRWVNASQSK